jgi:hypothetical protein
MSSRSTAGSNSRGSATASAGASNGRFEQRIVRARDHDGGAREHASRRRIPQESRCRVSGVSHRRTLLAEIRTTRTWLGWRKLLGMASIDDGLSRWCWPRSASPVFRSDVPMPMRTFVPRFIDIASLVRISDTMAGHRTRLGHRRAWRLADRGPYGVASEERIKWRPGSFTSPRASEFRTYWFAVPPNKRRTGLPAAAERRTGLPRRWSVLEHRGERIGDQHALEILVDRRRCRCLQVGFVR